MARGSRRKRIINCVDLEKKYLCFKLQTQKNSIFFKGNGFYNQN